MKVKTTLLLVVWTLVLLGILLSPIRSSFIPDSGVFRYADKFVHIGLFAVTGFLSIYGAGFFPKFRYRLLFGLTFGLVLALGTEFGQRFVISRTPDFYDLLSDLAGLFFGLLSNTLLYCWKLKL